MLCSILLKLFEISGCSWNLSLKKPFNYEKTFQQEKIAIGRETDSFYHTFMRKQAEKYIGRHSPYPIQGRRLWRQEKQKTGMSS
jgi:hypothetical protein